MPAVPVVFEIKFSVVSGWHRTLRGRSEDRWADGQMAGNLGGPDSNLFRKNVDSPHASVTIVSAPNLFRPSRCWKSVPWGHDSREKDLHMNIVTSNVWSTANVTVKAVTLGVRYSLDSDFGILRILITLSINPVKCECHCTRRCPNPDERTSNRFQPCWHSWFWKFLHFSSKELSLIHHGGRISTYKTFPLIEALVLIRIYYLLEKKINHPFPDNNRSLDADKGHRGRLVGSTEVNLNKAGVSQDTFNVQFIFNTRKEDLRKNRSCNKAVWSVGKTRDGQKKPASRLRKGSAAPIYWNGSSSRVFKILKGVTCFATANWPLFAYYRWMTMYSAWFFRYHLAAVASESSSNWLGIEENEKLFF